MADAKLSDLSASGAVAATDVIYSVVTAGAGGVKATAAQLKTFMSASPTLVTPTLGVAAGTSLALGGATIGSNALAITGHVLVEGVTSTGATGTGKIVFDGTPTLVTPVLGVATATSINKVTITAPATSSTLTVADGSSLITSGANSITLTSTGATNVTLPTSGTLATQAVSYQAVITFVIDGGGSAITTGVKGDLEIPFACTITRATLLADQSGSIVVDIWKDTYANYPPTIADVITASAPPTISSATKSQDSTLTGWTTTIAAGDTLRFNVNSATTITRVTLSLKVTKT